jgi:hypothetical protein
MSPHEGGAILVANKNGKCIAKRLPYWNLADRLWLVHVGGVEKLPRVFFRENFWEHVSSMVTNRNEISENRFN